MNISKPIRFSSFKWITRPQINKIAGHKILPETCCPDPYLPLDIKSHMTAERTANDYKAIAETMKSPIKCYINNHKYIFIQDNQEIRLVQLRQLEDKTSVCATIIPQYAPDPGQSATNEITSFIRRCPATQWRNPNYWISCIKAAGFNLYDPFTFTFSHIMIRTPRGVLTM